MMKIAFQDQVIGLAGIYLHQVLNFGWMVIAEFMKD